VTQLAQAYIHLKPYRASDKEVRSLGRYAKRVAIKTASNIYGGDVQIEVQIEEGSLITRVTVVGLLLVGEVYSHVADYKGFKESVVELCDDAREFAVDVCAPFVRKAGVPQEDVYRFERRLKTPGKLYRLSKRLDKLEHSVSELSPKDVQKELAKIRAELDTATKDMSASEKSLVEDGLRRQKLPSPEKWPAPDPPRVAVQRKEESQPGFFEDEEDEVPQRRRVIFKEKATVPRRGSQRRKKGRAPKNPDLLVAD